MTALDPQTTVTVVVLCGGSSQRLGMDKLGAALGRSTVLDTCLADLPQLWPVVAVGPERATRRPVTWAVETPPGGGPLAAIAAGLALVTTDLVVVVAGDMPFVGSLVAPLAAALADRPATGAVAAADGAGRTNPLLAAYRTTALLRAMPDDPAGGRARVLLESLATSPLTVAPEDAVDVDTPEALAAARRRVGR